MGNLDSNAKEYKIEYVGGFVDKKDKYKAGETVELKAAFATDTNYKFIVDGTEKTCSVSGPFLVCKFVMPAHDIKVELISKNTMNNKMRR